MNIFARSGWFCFVCALAVFGSLGCRPNLEKNKQFADEVARADRVDEELKNTRIDVGKLNNEVSRLSTEVAALKKGVPAAGVSDEVMNGLNQHLATLDAQVRALSAALKAQPAAAAARTAGESEESAAPAPVGRTRLTPSSAKSSAVKAAAARPAPTPKGQVAVTIKGSRKNAATTGRAGNATKKATSPRAADNSDGAPQGFYHHVTASDTIASIAEKYGVSTSALIKANSLSASNPHIYTGEPLYIPKRASK